MKPVVSERVPMELFSQDNISFQPGKCHRCTLKQLCNLGSCFLVWRLQGRAHSTTLIPDNIQRRFQSANSKPGCHSSGEWRELRLKRRGMFGIVSSMPAKDLETDLRHDTTHGENCPSSASLQRIKQYGSVSG